MAPGPEPYEEFEYDPQEPDDALGDWKSNAGERLSMRDVLERELPIAIEELMGQ